MLTRHQHRVLSFAPVSAVFATPELLETILSYVDIRTLLTSVQRVCHHWHIIVTNSPLLQRLLYFRPQLQHHAFSDGPQHTSQEDHPDRVPNPLLKEAFPSFYILGRFVGGCHDREAFEMMRMSASPALTQAFMQPKASWRFMLITQPPVMKLGCWMTEQPTCGELPVEQFKILDFAIPSLPNSNTHCPSSGGLRMGKLYDMISRWMGTPSRPSFTIYWTPHDVNTLKGGFHLLNMAPHGRHHPELKACGGAVDILLRGERWGNPFTRHARLAAEFRRKYTFKSVRKNDGMDLEPVSDSGYKSPWEWVKILDGAQEI
jgi:hypothetical protein